MSTPRKRRSTSITLKGPLAKAFLDSQGYSSTDRPMTDDEACDRVLTYLKLNMSDPTRIGLARELLRAVEKHGVRQTAVELQRKRDANTSSSREADQGS